MAAERCKSFSKITKSAEQGGAYLATRLMRDSLELEKLATLIDPLDCEEIADLGR